MEKVLALLFSFIVFVIGLAFLITGRAAVGLLLIAVCLGLAFLAFRRRDAWSSSNASTSAARSAPGCSNAGIAAPNCKKRPWKCAWEPFSSPAPIATANTSSRRSQNGEKRTAFAGLLALLLCLPALAADYHFKVNDLRAEVTVRQDAKVELRYAITFTPQPGSHAVDIVDIGMPNENYDLGSARAAIAGTPLADIRASEFVKPGVEVHLNGQEIVPGQTGTLEFSILVWRMVYRRQRGPRLRLHAVQVHLV